MRFEEGEFYHVYNRGNQKQKIFFNRGNYLFFTEKMYKELTPYAELLAYCLMPNHFHILVRIKIYDGQTTPTGRKLKTLSNGIGTLLRSYTRAIQKQQDFTGSLFQQKTKARQVISEDINHPNDDLSICMNYIHQNPVKAGFVTKAEHWQFSSFCLRSPMQKT